MTVVAETGEPQQLGQGLAAMLQGRVEQLQQLTLLQGEGRRAPTPFETHFDLVDADVVSEDAELGYAPRLFAQLALPYRDPGPVPAWRRKNGTMTLSVRPGEWLDPASKELREGYPYGIIPRLILMWMATEVLETKQRTLELGASLYRFTTRLGLHRPSQVDTKSTWRPGGSDGVRVFDQMGRLFFSTLIVHDGRSGVFPDGRIRSGSTGASIQLVTRYRLWTADLQPMDADHPDWASWITLGQEFYESILAGGVPLKLEAVAKLKGSPLRFDIYTWLVHRLGYLKKPTPPIPWSALADQFGSDYRDVRMFKRQFLRQLAVVCRDVYSEAKVEPTEAGLILRPSKRAVPSKSSQ